MVFIGASGPAVAARAVMVHHRRVDDESGSHEPDKDETPEAPTSEGTDAGKDDANDVVLPSYRTLREATAGLRAMAEDAARTQQFINQAVAPLQHVIAESQRFERQPAGSFFHCPANRLCRI